MVLFSEETQKPSLPPSEDQIKHQNRFPPPLFTPKRDGRPAHVPSPRSRIRIAYRSSSEWFGGPGGGGGGQKEVVGIGVLGAESRGDARSSRHRVFFVFCG